MIIVFSQIKFDLLRTNKILKLCKNIVIYLNNRFIQKVFIVIVTRNYEKKVYLGKYSFFVDVR